MSLLYNLILFLAALSLSPLIFFKLISDKRYMVGLSERLGLIPSDILNSLNGQRPIWFHAASVGEVIASQRLLDEIRVRWPGRKLIVSTFTPTGNKAAREKLKADGVIFLPIDFPWIVGRVLKKIEPSVLILMETEIWPNLIRKAGRMGIPVVIVNGRISDRSYGKYWFISPLLKRVFTNISRFLMQSEGDAGRIMALGADPTRVSVTGNLKFDLNLIYKDMGFMDDWGGPLLIAGSTHKGEESQLLDTFRELKVNHPDLKLLLAPRHLERVREVERILEERHLSYVRRSEVEDSVAEPVLLLDTLGELAFFYRYGNIVFIGGTLVPVGGHNLLEPALYGKPVIFGPHTENFRDAARTLIESGGGIKVNNAGDLRNLLERLLSDKELCRSIGEMARQAVLNNQGATDRTVDALMLVGQAH